VLFDPSGYECNNNEVQPTPRNRCPRTLSPCFFSWKLTLAGLSGDFKLHGSPLCIYRLTTNKESRRTGRPQTPKLSRLLAQKAMGHQPRPRRRLCVRFPIFRGKADQLTIGLKGCGESYPTTVPIVAARSFPGPYIVPCRLSAMSLLLYPESALRYGATAGGIGPATKRIGLLLASLLRFIIAYRFHAGR